MFGEGEITITDSIPPTTTHNTSSVFAARNKDPLSTEIPCCLIFQSNEPC